MKPAIVPINQNLEIMRNSLRKLPVKCVKAWTVGRAYSGKAVEAAAGIGALALSSAAFYRVRELLAAFLLFSVVFCTVAVAFLILWLVERGAHDAAVRLETHMAHISARHNVAPARVRAIHVHRTPPWS